MINEIRHGVYSAASAAFGPTGLHTAALAAVALSFACHELASTDTTEPFRAGLALVQPSMMLPTQHDAVVATHEKLHITGRVGIYRMVHHKIVRCLTIGSLTALCFLNEFLRECDEADSLPPVLHTIVLLRAFGIYPPADSEALPAAVNSATFSNVAGQRRELTTASCTQPLLTLSCRAAISLPTLLPMTVASLTAKSGTSLQAAGTGIKRARARSTSGVGRQAPLAPLRPAASTQATGVNPFRLTTIQTCCSRIVSISHAFQYDRNTLRKQEV